MIGISKQTPEKSNVSLLIVSLQEERDELHLRLNESLWIEPGLRITFKRKDGLCLIETTDECLADVLVDGRPVINSLLYTPGQELKINRNRYLLVPKETRVQKRKFTHTLELMKNNPAIYFVLSGVILFSGLSLLERAKLHPSRAYSDRAVMEKSIGQSLRSEITQLDRTLKTYGNDKDFLLRKIEVLSHMARVNPGLARLAFVKIQNNTNDVEVRKLASSIISRL